MIEARLPLTTWPFTGTAADLMARLGSLPLAHQPGERWLYHMGAEILGVLVARVSGQSLGAFLRERIFQPLGMKDSGFYVPDEKMDRLPICYGSKFPSLEMIVLDPARGGTMARPPAYESGGGGLVSTVDDMLALGLMMMKKGVHLGQHILSRPSVELMTTDHLTPEQKGTSPFFENFWNARGWGLGVGVFTRRASITEVPGRFGWDGAFGTSWYVDPNEQLVGVLMTQRSPDVLKLPDVVTDFWTSVYQLIED
jgi:CubicO group peptidase (beta-lactamase class C family)